jgi:hypothetical protein
MPQHEPDRSSKWLIQNHSRAILRLGESPPVRNWKALHTELVQPRQIPDGLLEVIFEGRKSPAHVLIEIATYAEKRIAEQASDDLMLAFQHLRKVPDLLVLVLRPKGRQEVATNWTAGSELGWSALSASWKIVELWKQKAEALLAVGTSGSYRGQSWQSFPDRRGSC